MKKSITAVLFATLLLGASPTLAQLAPNDSGAGIQRGMQQLNNSGQVGDVTLFNRNGKTLVVLNVKSAPAGRHEAAHIHRGKACDQTVDPNPAFALSDIVNGHSATTLSAPTSKLVSGNYVVIVHSASNMAHYVSCGLLYQ